MDLGNILAREGNTPLTGRIVKFMIQGQSEGVIVSALASARPSFPVLVEVLKKIDDEDVYDDIESLKAAVLAGVKVGPNRIDLAAPLRTVNAASEPHQCCCGWSASDARWWTCRACSSGEG